MRYVSILRGINVSGQKNIKMTDLKSLYEKLGFGNVVTYIQSGNVIFDSNDKNTTNIKTTIEKAIEKKYRFTVPVIIRTNKELKKIIAQCPFNNVDFVENGTKVLITFSSTKPELDKVTKIQKFVVPPEELIVIRKEIYLYCPNGYGKSKLSNSFLENKLGIEATTRNIKSVLKLHELSLNTDTIQ